MDYAVLFRRGDVNYKTRTKWMQFVPFSAHHHFVSFASVRDHRLGMTCQARPEGEKRGLLRMGGQTMRNTQGTGNDALGTPALDLTQRVSIYALLPNSIPEVSALESSNEVFWVTPFN